MTLRGALAGLILLLVPAMVSAGNQREEALSASVRSALSKSIADQAPNSPSFEDSGEAAMWFADMSRRLTKRMPDEKARMEFLRAVHYEAIRAGLDPQWVLGLIEVESAFRKYAVSAAGARGYMQVMPFWVRQIGRPDDNLFNLRTNLRFGCVILRHYLDIEKGDLYRALGRYNGSLGKPDYPQAVRAAWKKNWQYRSAIALN